MAIDFEKEIFKPFLKKASYEKNDVPLNAYKRLSQNLNKKEIAIEDKERFITE
jgi:hypothetical protein